MKAYTVRVTFIDRREGPGTGRTLFITASSLPGAIAKGSRVFWKVLNTKQRNDARRSGLTVTAQPKHEVPDENS